MYDPAYVITRDNVHAVVRGHVFPPAACYPPSASRARPCFSMSGQDEDEEVLGGLEATIVLRRMMVWWRNASVLHIFIREELK